MLEAVMQQQKHDYYQKEVSSGFVLRDSSNPCRTGKVFDSQVVILEHRSIICPGYCTVLHIHEAIEGVSVQALICLVDKNTGEKGKTCPKFVKQDQIAIMRLECAAVICLESFKDFPQMGRFSLRDEGRTRKRKDPIGKVLGIVE